MTEEVERRAPGAEESSSPIIAGRTREDLQEEVDNYARAHPGSFGLGKHPSSRISWSSFPAREKSVGEVRGPQNRRDLPLRGVRDPQRRGESDRGSVPGRRRRSPREKPIAREEEISGAGGLGGNNGAQEGKRRNLGLAEQER